MYVEIDIIVLGSAAAVEIKVMASVPHVTIAVIDTEDDVVRHRIIKTGAKKQAVMPFVNCCRTLISTFRISDACLSAGAGIAEFLLSRMRYLATPMHKPAEANLSMSVL